jgi:predicted RNase H-like HicB family nuclease
MNLQHYTYRVTWSPKDGEHLGLCTEFPSLSWLAKTPAAALKGIQRAVTDVVAEMAARGETEMALAQPWSSKTSATGATGVPNRQKWIDTASTTR